MATIQSHVAVALALTVASVYAQAPNTGGYNMGDTGTYNMGGDYGGEMSVKCTDVPKGDMSGCLAKAIETSGNGGGDGFGGYGGDTGGYGDSGGGYTGNTGGYTGGAGGCGGAGAAGGYNNDGGTGNGGEMNAGDTGYGGYGTGRDETCNRDENMGGEAGTGNMGYNNMAGANAGNMPSNMPTNMGENNAGYNGGDANMGENNGGDPNMGTNMGTNTGTNMGTGSENMPVVSIKASQLCQYNMQTEMCADPTKKSTARAAELQSSCADRIMGAASSKEAETACLKSMDSDIGISGSKCQFVKRGNSDDSFDECVVRKDTVDKLCKMASGNPGLGCPIDAGCMMIGYESNSFGSSGNSDPDGCMNAQDKASCPAKVCVWEADSAGTGEGGGYCNIKQKTAVEINQALAQASKTCQAAGCDSIVGTSTNACEKYMGTNCKAISFTNPPEPVMVTTAPTAPGSGDSYYGNTDSSFDNTKAKCVAKPKVSLKCSGNCDETKCEAISDPGSGMQCKFEEKGVCALDQMACSAQEASKCTGDACKWNKGEGIGGGWCEITAEYQDAGATGGGATGPGMTGGGGKCGKITAKGQCTSACKWSVKKYCDAPSCSDYADKGQNECKNNAMAKKLGCAWGIEGSCNIAQDLGTNPTGSIADCRSKSETECPLTKGCDWMAAFGNGMGGGDYGGYGGSASGAPTGKTTTSTTTKPPPTCYAASVEGACDGLETRADCNKKTSCDWVAPPSKPAVTCMATTDFSNNIKACAMAHAQGASGSNGGNMGMGMQGSGMPKALDFEGYTNMGTDGNIGMGGAYGTGAAGGTDQCPYMETSTPADKCKMLNGMGAKCTMLDTWPFDGKRATCAPCRNGNCGKPDCSAHFFESKCTGDSDCAWDAACFGVGGTVGRCSAKGISCPANQKACENEYQDPNQKCTEIVGNAQGCECKKGCDLIGNKRNGMCVDEGKGPNTCAELNTLFGFGVNDKMDDQDYDAKNKYLAASDACQLMAGCVVSLADGVPFCHDGSVTQVPCSGYGMAVISDGTYPSNSDCPKDRCELAPFFYSDQDMVMKNGKRQSCFEKGKAPLTTTTGTTTTVTTIFVPTTTSSSTSVSTITTSSTITTTTTTTTSPTSTPTSTASTTPTTQVDAKTEPWLNPACQPGYTGPDNYNIECPHTSDPSRNVPSLVTTAESPAKGKYPVTIPVYINQGKACQRTEFSSFLQRDRTTDVACFNVNRRCITPECTKNRDLLGEIATAAVTSTLAKVSGLANPASNTLELFGDKLVPGVDAVKVVWEYRVDRRARQRRSRERRANALLFIAFEVVVLAESADDALAVRAAMDKKPGFDEEFTSGLKGSTDANLMKSVAGEDFYGCLGEDADREDRCTSADIYFGDPETYSYTSPAPVTTTQFDSGATGNSGQTDAEKLAEAQKQAEADKNKAAAAAQNAVDEAKKAQAVAEEALSDALKAVATEQTNLEDLKAELKKLTDISVKNDEQKAKTAELKKTVADQELVVETAENDRDDAEYEKTIAVAAASKAETDQVVAVKAAQEAKVAADEAAEKAAAAKAAADKAAKVAADKAAKDATTAEVSAKKKDDDEAMLYAIIGVVGGVLICALAIVIIILIKRRSGDGGGGGGGGGTRGQAPNTYQNPTYSSQPQGRAPANQQARPVQNATDDYDA